MSFSGDVSQGPNFIETEGHYVAQKIHKTNNVICKILHTEDSNKNICCGHVWTE